MVRRFIHFTLRKLWLALAILLVLAAVVLSIVRYTLPYLDNYREDIESFIAEQFNQEVSIGSLSADWSSFGPSLVLEDLELTVSDEYPFDLSIRRTHLVLNLWQSLWQREWLLEDFVLDGVHFSHEVDWRTSSGDDLPLVDALEQLLLDQLESFQVVNSEVVLRDSQDIARTLFIEQLSWVNRDAMRQGTGRFRVSELTANSLNFVINAEGPRFRDMQGELYLEADNLDLSPWLESVIAGVEITRAELNVNAWFDFAEGRLGNAQVHFGENRLVWQRDEESHSLVSSPVTWGLWPQQDGFLMAGEALTLQVDEVEWPVESVRWSYRGGEHLWNLRNLSFSETAPLWSLFGSPGAQIRDWFAGIQPQGVVNDVQVRLDREFDWSFYVRADDVQWQSHRGVPGLTGLGFELWSGQQQGAFTLRGEEVNFVSPMTFSAAQQLSQIDWAGYWTQLEEGFRVALPQGRVRMANVALDQQFSLTREHNQSPVVEWWLQGEGAELPVADALELLPLQIGPELTEYLQGAVQEGEVSTLNMLWRGDLDSFPYYHGEGIFMARLIADNLDFKFQPDWPAIEQTRLTLSFEDQGLHMRARGGSMLGTELVSVDARIPDLMLPEPWLILDASARGNAGQAREVFINSPLADTVGVTLQQLDSADTFEGAFELRLPLFDAAGEQTDDKDQPIAVGVQGYVDFNGQSLTILPIDLSLNNLDGRLYFDNQALEASAISASIFQLPVFVSLQGGPETASDAFRARAPATEEVYQLSVQMDSSWGTADLQASPVLSWLAPFTSGEVVSDTDFRLQIAEGRLDYDWQMRNVLDEASIELPQPLRKGMGEPGFVDIRVRGNEERLHAHLLWPDAIRFETELTLGETQLDRALLELGQTHDRGPAIPDQGMDAYADVEDIDVSAWLAVLSMLGADTGEDGGLPWQLPPLQQVSAEVHKATWMNQQFNLVQLGGQREAQRWELTANADEGRVHVSVPLAGLAEDEDIRVRIDYLNLVRTRNDEASEDADSVSLPRPDGAFFDRLPALHVVCEVCRYEGNEIGRIEGRLNPGVPGGQLEQLHIRRSGAEVNLTGGWYEAESGYVSSVNGWVAVADVGNLVADFGGSSVVRDSNAQVELDLSWPGSPAEFDLEQLNGEIEWRLGSGYLRDVSDGGARLFSLFSLESLMRKLTLDFRDIFARGMFYSSFRGTLNVEDGVVFTDDTRMNGSAGDMEVIGRTNLVTEELDYKLVYIPKVTSSLPVLVAWMVNPPTGLAALLIDRVLHDAQVISRLEYSISGTVSEPIVNEEARTQTDVELPEVEFDQLLEENNDPD